MRVPDAVSTSTPCGRARSSGRPSATSSPRSMIATRSQTCSTSLSRWVLRSTATPRRRSSTSSPRTVRRPAGSSALVGSSRSSSAGCPTSACAIPRRCCMPFDIVSMRRSRASVRPTSSSSSARSAAPPAGAGEPLMQREQLVGARPPGNGQLREVAERAAGRGRPGGRAADLGGAAGRPDEAAGDLHERGSCPRRSGRAARRARPRRPRGRRRAARGSRRGARGR